MSEFADYRPGGERTPPYSAADGLVIRPAGHPDLPGVAAIAAEREGEPLEKWVAAFERTHDESLAGRSLLLVATLRDRVVGYGKTRDFTPPANSPLNAAPAGWYLTGVVIHPEHRRRGLGLELTLARLTWIRQRSGTAYYFANARNQVSIDLHRTAGFVELTRDFSFPGAEFEGGTGILFVCKRQDALAPKPT